MAWNPSPEVAVARDAAAKLGNADEVIVLWLNHETRQIGAATYGRTKALCSHAGQLGDAAYDAVCRKFQEIEEKS